MAQDSIHTEQLIAATSNIEIYTKETPAPSLFIAPSEFTYAG